MLLLRYKTWAPSSQKLALMLTSCIPFSHSPWTILVFLMDYSCFQTLLLNKIEESWVCQRCSAESQNAFHKVLNVLG